MIKSTHINVNSESLRIFSRIFPTSDEETHKGTVKWSQFVTAMADAGCSATHRGGSAVSFSRIDQPGSIVFHKPHPESTVDPVGVQIMGKRLSTWFGWVRETFV